MAISSIAPSFKSNEQTAQISNRSKAALAGGIAAALVHFSCADIDRYKLEDAIRNNNQELDEFVKSASQTETTQKITDLLKKQKTEMDNFIKKAKSSQIKAIVLISATAVALQLLLSSYFGGKKEN